MLICKASINNIKEILDLYQSLASKDYCVWDMEYPNYETITFDIDNNGLYVGIIDGKIVSAISLVKDLELTSYNWKENSNVIELSRFGVLKEYQGKGISKQILSFIINLVKEHGCKAVHLACQYQNIPAKKLYENFGFKIVCENDMYENHYLLMEKVI